MLNWLKTRLKPTPAVDVPTLTPQEAQARMRTGALLLDVRTVAERQVAFIPQSRSLPLSELPGQADRLPKDRVLITQCASGHRSRSAARWLAQRGYQVYNLGGGFHAWQAAGLPTKQR
ncbi:rhodanese-like domain-containing protein [Deinococcus sp. MIMF12]|uniref:Rhodanese-like domain-containing protein n=1 Tax=Deinococcus rhizophilus TaxID=3049544 RepID=A0ABT7JJY9_9DEIO|nr:rhodanese-like domain-containing protein [Deinococcus rhizophilus]MDL2345376.1 rhodanese-like domain-containing protein [Deinococcus rhizophilus]